VLVGRPGDGCADVRARCRLPVHDLAGRTDLPALAAVLAQVDVLVGNDSGVTHLATAMGTPTVAVFGPSNAVAWGPWWPGTDTHGRPAPSPHRVVKLDLPCQPCLYVGHTLGSPAGCPTRDCLAWLPADRVLAATVAVLAMPEATAARAV
ncbi:MAG: glycosyl transferase, partial [Chloroflexi bacterium CFX6]|nr:glycosyl transferase [Chloroflexi bacterium CFX6]